MELHLAVVLFGQLHVKLIQPQQLLLVLVQLGLQVLQQGPRVRALLRGRGAQQEVVDRARRLDWDIQTSDLSMAIANLSLNLITTLDRRHISTLKGSEVRIEVSELHTS